MLSRYRGTRLLVGASALAALQSVACEKVPLVAPTGSTITLTASTTAMSANGTAYLAAQVLEAPGTPPHSGTHVTFTTTLGRLEPSEAVTDLTGRVHVTFYANGANGNATISAVSGAATTGATGSVRIAVGTAAVGRVSLGALPASMPQSGGTTTLSAIVVDINGNALAGTPVTFLTTAGTLSSSLVLTDANGVAVTTLTSTQAATVTATVGATAPTTGTGTPPGPTGQASGSVTIGLANAPTVTITAPATIMKGLPAAFTFTVTPAATNGSAIRELIVNWGDGAVDNLGSISGASPQSHVFAEDGSYRITATVTDVAGNGNSASTTVVVVPLPQPSILVSASPASQTVGGNVTFTITITPPAGVSIRSTSIDYGDGHSDELGGATSATRVHVYSAAGTKEVTVTVVDSANQTSEGSTTVIITP